MRAPRLTERPLPRRHSPESQAVEWVRLERQRQIQSEGWSAEHDDQHTDGSMLRAAVIYLWHGTDKAAPLGSDGSAPLGWPWDRQWWKPKGRYRNVIRAGALCLAERDRLRRAGLPTRPADHKYQIAIRELADIQKAGAA